MEVRAFVEALGADFFVGVPDSQLGALCDYLMRRYGIGKQHMIAANEGNCAAIAAGYHLATGHIPVVYLQNSGLGNLSNPATSLLHPRVYGIPCIFVVGWRGEPGVRDEPQHMLQGEITPAQLALLGIETLVVDATTTPESLQEALAQAAPRLAGGTSIAIVVRKGSLQPDGKATYADAGVMRREDILRRILSISAGDPVLCTTGKASRELYTLREAQGQSHAPDFLTVGSMGHCASIALGVALHAPHRKIWCIDGDGAALMHMGGMAVIGAQKPSNLVHILINNGAHESVGGMPTVSQTVDWPALARACSYPTARQAADDVALDAALQSARTSRELCFIEVKASLDARVDLGRPKETPAQNKGLFMRKLREDPEASDG